MIEQIVFAIIIGMLGYALIKSVISPLIIGFMMWCATR